MPIRLERPQPYDELDHTADTGVIVRGRSPEEALARLVLAFAELVTGGAPVAADGESQIVVEPGDRAAIAIDVLREVLFQFDSARRIPTVCEVRRFDPETGAELRVTTGPHDERLHAEGLELKAVTLHAARFEREGADWVAQVVFDV